jgi:hypothetical protein
LRDSQSLDEPTRERDFHFAGGFWNRESVAATCPVQSDKIRIWEQKSWVLQGIKSESSSSAPSKFLKRLGLEHPTIGMVRKNYEDLLKSLGSEKG